MIGCPGISLGCFGGPPAIAKTVGSLLTANSVGGTVKLAEGGLKLSSSSACGSTEADIRRHGPFSECSG
jgi:hypothetical protein